MIDWLCWFFVVRLAPWYSASHSFYHFMFPFFITRYIRSS